MKRLLTLIVLTTLGCSSGPEPAPEISAELVERHLRSLASDDFQGRGPGSPGGDAAADYIAQAFAEIGLEPVNGSYYQSVPMIGSTPDPSGMRLDFDIPLPEGVPRPPEGVVQGEFYEPTYMDEYVMWSGDAQATRATARGELVFVGYGVNAPENSWDDYGIDVSGKVVMILVNDPPAPADEPELFGGDAMTYYGRWTYKFEEAARQGAVGAFIVHETGPAGYPWSVVRGGWTGEQFALPAASDGVAPSAIQGWLSYATAAELAGLAGEDFQDLMQQAASRSFRPVELGIEVEASVSSRVRTVETSNVVGLLPGSERPDEVITVTSHYDHFGIGEAIDGDAIYNGAYDNASGTALMIGMAEAAGRLSEAPARSILFIATAAEEQGLLGSAWYAQEPLFPLSQTVAEINVDGANLWGETDDMIVMGEERSDLGTYVRARAAEMNVTLVPDAEPEKGFFFRSDHFPIAKAGVPSLYIEHGRDFRGMPEGWGDQMLEQYTAERYHSPKDEYDESWVYDGAVQHGMLALRIALDIARDDTWPNWNADSEFRAARDAMRPGG